MFTDEDKKMAKALAGVFAPGCDPDEFANTCALASSYEDEGHDIPKRDIGETLFQYRCRLRSMFAPARCPLCNASDAGPHHVCPVTPAPAAPSIVTGTDSPALRAVAAASLDVTPEEAEAFEGVDSDNITSEAAAEHYVRTGEHVFDFRAPDVPALVDTLANAIVAAANMPPSAARDSMQAHLTIALGWARLALEPKREG